MILNIYFHVIIIIVIFLDNVKTQGYGSGDQSLYGGQYGNLLSGNPLNNLFGGQIMEILNLINENDDFKCIPKMLCRLIGDRYPGGTPVNNFISPSLIYQIPEFPASNYILTLGRAAVLGFVGGSYGCDDSYPRCPQDDDELLYYLNNYKGGFFRFFSAYDARNVKLKQNNNTIVDITQNIYEVLKNSSEIYSSKNNGNLPFRESKIKVNKFDLNLGEFFPKQNNIKPNTLVLLDDKMLIKHKNKLNQMQPRILNKNEKLQFFSGEQTTKWPALIYNNQDNYDTTTESYAIRQQNNIKFDSNRYDEITAPNRYNENNYYKTTPRYTTYPTRYSYPTSYTTRYPSRPYNIYNGNQNPNTRYPPFRYPQQQVTQVENTYVPNNNIYVTNSKGVIEYYMTPEGKKVYV